MRVAPQLEAQAALGDGGEAVDVRRVAPQAGPIDEIADTRIRMMGSLRSDTADERRRGQNCASSTAPTSGQRGSALTTIAPKSGEPSLPNGRLASHSVSPTESKGFSVSHSTSMWTTFWTGTDARHRDRCPAGRA